MKIKAQSETVAPSLPSVEHIENYDSQIQISKDSTLTVTEKIVYDFANVPDKHGIFRNIPFQYITKEGTPFSVHINVNKVTDESGHPYTYKLGRTSTGELEIKIGNADQTVSGIKTYVINYTVGRAISSLPDHDEVYWNAIGTEWKVPIAHATAQVELPEAIVSGLQVTCYIGIKGSTDTCSSTTTDQKIISFTAPSKLYYGQAMTVVVGFPKGIVQPPSSSQTLIWWLQDNWPIGIPLVVLIIMVIIWFKYGRDPKGRGIIIAEYEAPDKLSPIEVGTIIDQKVDSRDISSIIIDLAVRKYLKIKEVGEGTWSTDYEFTKLKEGNDLERSFEHTFFDGLFEGRTTVKLSDLKTKFYITSSLVETEVYRTLKSEGYFKIYPLAMRSCFLGLGILAGLGGIVLAVYLSNGIINWTIIGPVIAGIIIIIGGYFMSTRTQKGVLAKEHIAGLKLFLSVTEKDRLKFHNAPEKKPELFEKCLPYAMVLKVEQEWAGQFKDIYTKPPDWYSGNWTTFNVVTFSSRISSFSATANSSLTVAPSKGGSGFSGGSSGGGFGGGGGGSW